jgi:homoserine acetyltransferase
VRYIKEAAPGKTTMYSQEAIASNEVLTNFKIEVEDFGEYSAEMYPTISLGDLLTAADMELHKQHHRRGSWDSVPFSKLLRK